METKQKLEQIIKEAEISKENFRTEILNSIKEGKITNVIHNVRELVKDDLVIEELKDILKKAFSKKTKTKKAKETETETN